MNDNFLHKWRVTGITATLVIILVVPVYVVKELAIRSAKTTDEAGWPTDSAKFVGRGACVDCHREAYESWLGSHHDHAMAEAADSTVLGDFDDATFEHGNITARFFKKDGKFLVHTQGPGGEPRDFEIAYTFGITPLQQYLIPFPGGRLQSLTIAWDTVREEWFYLYPGQDIPPDDWLHWTRGAQNWNGMCAECHSTNLIKNYDPETKSFATTWSEIDVSCEACHGPGSRHVEWAEIPPMARPETENYDLVIRTSDIGSQQQVELCAPCHSRRSEIGDYDHTRAELLDNIVPTVLEDRLYHSDGQILDEVYVYGSFVQSKMFKNDVRCSDCHDVHSLERVADGNALCLQCHQAEVYDGYDHHFHKKEHEGKPSDGHLCVKCHMPESPYMVVDWRADHSLRVPRPDLTREISVPNACNQSGCHVDKTLEWHLEHYRGWYGIARKPHYGTVLAAGRSGSAGAGDQLINLAADVLYPSIVRATALSLLGGYPSEAATNAFNMALSDEDALVRYTAVRSVNVSDNDVMARLVAPLLFDPVRAVRMQAAARLAGLSPELFKAYQREAIESALTEYTEAMTYALDFAFAGHNLGNVYSALGDPQKAEKYYRTAIEIDDLFYPAKVNLAMILNATNRNDEAVQLLREVLEANPDEYEAAYSLGLLLAEMNKFEEAARFMARASEGMPANTRVLYNLGLVQQHLGRIGEAEATFTRALEVEPDNYDILFALADHYAKRGEPQLALRHAQRMVDLQPQNKLGHDLKRHIESMLGR
jgi:tetratricopeptide (TPR) repeat protein